MKTQILAFLLLSLSLLSAQTVDAVLGPAQPDGSFSLIGPIQVSPGTTTGADPCQVPQAFLDALGTFSNVLEDGSPQNQPSMAIPGTSTDEGIIGARYFLAAGWYYVCQIHNLTTAVANLQTQLGAAQASISALQAQFNTTQTSLSALQTQLAADEATIAGLQSSQPLNVLNLAAVCASSTSCTVSWTTSVPATTQLYYAPTTGAFRVAGASTALTLTHSVTIPTVSATTYNYYVVAIDANQNQKRAVCLPNLFGYCSFTAP